MSENVVYLHPKPEPVAHYLRLGAFHRQVEKLLAAGRLPVERVVVEASAFTHQKDVVGQLADNRPPRGLLRACTNATRAYTEPAAGVASPPREQ